MEVFQTRYCTLLYDNQTKVLDQLWTSETEHMTVEDYKHIQLNTVSNFVERKSTKIFVDFKNFRWLILPDIQIWTVENIITPLVNTGILKISYIVPVEMLSEMSMQQTLEEDKTQTFPYKYFSDEKEARQWLLSE